MSAELAVASASRCKIKSLWLLQAYKRRECDQRTCLSLIQKVKSFTPPKLDHLHTSLPSSASAPLSSCRYVLHAVQYIKYHIYSQNHAQKINNEHPSTQAYELRNAGAVIHGHSVNAMLATMLDPDASEFRATHLEMIKGIANHGFYSNMIVPIIENTARECELTDRLRDVMQKYPQSNAVLVRRHGVYVWGDSWVQAKTQFECYDYIFEAAVRMKQLGMDASAAPAPPAVENGHHAEPAAKRAKKVANGNGVAAKNDSRKKQPSCIVLDIEGTVAPITFVSEVLFPYARQRLRSHLESSFDSKETQKDIELIRSQAREDGEDFPPAAASSRQAIIDAAVKVCERHMDADRKSTALKSLQGHIWREGFSSGELRGELYRDVPDALAAWRLQGIKTYVYSSGSRQAQRDLFSHTTVGDLRPYISGFFDTTSGSKIEKASYENIELALGVDGPGDILFATDNIFEARAAAAAGWEVVIADRPGNKELPKDCEFRVVQSMMGLFTNW